MVRYWLNLISKRRNVNPATIADFASDILAEIMVPIYSIFVRIAEFFTQLSEDPRHYMSTFSMEYLIVSLRK